MKTSTVYALVAKDGKVLYIGRTAHPSVRAGNHRLENTTGGKSYDFVVLYTLPHRQACKMESQLIREHKLAGSAELNRGVKRLNEPEIMKLITSRKSFTVRNGKERRMCLVAAKFAGIRILTKKNGDNFRIIFL